MATQTCYKCGNPLGADQRAIMVDGDWRRVCDACWDKRPKPRTPLTALADFTPAQLGRRGKS